MPKNIQATNLRRLKYKEHEHKMRSKNW